MSRTVSYLLLGLAAVAAALGIYARLAGLGLWPLANDEYHTAQSVQNILASGLPAFECGGYYSRGILFQYIEALFLATGLFGHEFSLRLPSVLFQLAAVPALFWLAQRVGGRWVALAVCSVFALSMIEIETARYARWYAPLQAIFLWYCCFLYRVIIDGDESAKKWIYVLSIFGILIHESAALLAVLNILPLAYSYRTIRTVDVIAVTAIIVLVYLVLSIDFRHMGVSNYLPEDGNFYVHDVQLLGPLEVPKLLLPGVFQSTIWTALYGLMIVVVVGALWMLWQERRLSVLEKLTGTAVLFLCLLHLYGLVVYLLIMGWLIGWLRLEQGLNKGLVVATLAAVFTGGFWVAFAFTTTEWFGLFPDLESFSLKKLIVLFVKYPDIYFEVIYQWWEGQPKFTLLLALVLAVWSLMELLKTHGFSESVRLLLVIVVSMCVLVAALRQPYTSTRYTFFLYPLLLLMFCFALWRFSEWLFRNRNVGTVVATLACIGALAWSDDHSIRHIVSVDSLETNFKLNVDEVRRGHLWPRLDHKSPGDYVNEHRQPEDIVLSTVRSVHYYLDRLDYFFLEDSNQEFQGVSGCGGTREIWTNANLVYKEDRLHNLIDSSPQVVWLIVRTEAFVYLPDIELRLINRYQPHLVYTSLDQQIAVYRIPGQNNETMGSL